MLRFEAGKSYAIVGGAGHPEGRSGPPHGGEGSGLRLRGGGPSFRRGEARWIPAFSLKVSIRIKIDMDWYVC